MNVSTDVAPAAPAAAPADPRFAPPPKTQDETAALGIAFGVFAETMESKAAKAMVLAVKVLLFNFFVFAPPAAILAMLWLWR